ncbi:unnamed protein product, partial [Rotaria sp. Silwood2]
KNTTDDFTMPKRYTQDPIEETRILVLGLTGSGRNFDVTSSAIASKKMIFEPYQSLITYNDKRFVVKACDTRGLNDPNVRDEDTFEAIKNLYPSEFNLINRVIVCFKQDRIRADVHTSIPHLLDYLKSSGLKNENVILALTFFDGYKQDQINNYIAEMREHPIVGDLFAFASEIIVTTLPELTTLEDDFKEVFESRRDKMIEKYYSVLSEYVKPVAIMTHEKFIQEVEKHKANERENATAENNKLKEEYRRTTEQLQQELAAKTSDYENVNAELRSITKADEKENKAKIMQLQNDKQKLKDELKRLQELTPTGLCRSS